jgi:hypothetical protein
VTLTIKVVLSDAEEVHTISFRSLILSAERPGDLQRPSPLRRATQDQCAHSQPQKVPLPVYALSSTTFRANFYICVSRPVFLVQLIFAIAFLLCEVLLHTSFLSIPYQYLFRRAFPSVYRPDVEVRLHPYVASGLLFVSVTTLLLFFATGLYSEKIGYANLCVHDAFS